MTNRIEEVEEIRKGIKRVLQAPLPSGVEDSLEYFIDLMVRYLHSQTEEARRQGENRIIKWVEDTDILVMLSPKKREEWQALKGGE